AAASLSTPLCARTWYVDVQAEGVGDGTSPEDAWTSFAKIRQSQLRGGDVVRVFGGKYNEVFTVTKGGTSSAARITYKGAGTPMPVVYGINGGATDYIAVIGLQFTQPDPSFGIATTSNPHANNTPAIELRGATGWLIQDNYFFQTYGPPIDLHYGTENRYNVICANRFDQIGYLPEHNYLVGNDIIGLNGDHNLVEYNIFGIGEHRIYTYSSHTIIRNNLDVGTNEMLFPQSRPYPEHIDDVHGGYARENDRDFTSARDFIERNFWADNAGSNGHNNIFQDYYNK